MDNSEFKYSKLALSLALSLSLSGCFSDNDGNNDEDKPEPPPPTQNVALPPAALETQAGAFTVSVVDALGLPIGNTVNATITFTSSEEGLVTPQGNELTDADKSTTSSLFSYSVSAIPSSGLTYDFVVTADGYLSNSGSVIFSDTVTEAAQEIKLTKRDFTSDEIAVVSKTSTLAELDEDADITYSAEAGLTITGGDNSGLISLPQSIEQDGVAVGGSTVSIKSGTKFIDKNGDALTTVPTMTVAYFANEATRTQENDENDGNEVSSLDAFPGGLNLSVEAPDNNSEQVAGAFTSGGFVAIELQDNDGNKVKTFGEDENGEPISITVGMQVDKNTSNPCPVAFDSSSSDNLSVQAQAVYSKGVCIVETPTARPLMENDIFPVWSYDEELGKWAFENYGVVVDSGNAKTYDVQVDVKHLSYWNLDFFTYRIGARKCPSGNVSFNIVDNNNQPNRAPVTLNLIANGYDSKFTDYSRHDLSRGYFNNPPSFPVRMKMLLNGENVLDGVVGEASADGQSSAVDFSNLCDLNGKTIIMNVSPTIITKSITTQLVCSNTEDFDVNTDPTVTPLKVDIFKNNRFLQVVNSTGSFAIDLEEGATYTAKFNGGESQISVNDTPGTIDVPIECEVEEQPITGGTGATGGT